MSAPDPVEILVADYRRWMAEHVEEIRFPGADEQAEGAPAERDDMPIALILLHGAHEAVIEPFEQRLKEALRDALDDAYALATAPGVADQLRVEIRDEDDPPGPDR